MALTFTREDTRVAKASAVVWMCMHHLFAFPDRFPAGVGYAALLPWNLENALGHVGRVCVAMFVCLSGFGTYLALEKAENPWKTARRKIGGLYQKFWAVFLVFIPVALLLRDPQVKLNFWDLAANFTALHTDFNGEWWFLPPFLVLTALSPLLVGLMRKTKRDWMWWIAVLLGQLLLPEFQYESKSISATLYNALVFLPGFWLGCLMARERLFDWWLNHIGPWTSLGITAGCVGLRIFAGQGVDVLLAPVLCAASAGFARGVPLLRKVKAEIGSVSTEIWLTHSFFCYHFVPEIVFAPRYSVLVLLWLLAMSYGAGKIITTITDKIKTASR